jgi:hypothetical protein
MASQPTNTTMKVKFRGAECDVAFGEYENGRTAIRLTENGSPFATATINDPDMWLGKSQVLIKNYSENEGMADALVAARIVEKQEETKLHPHGASAWICKLIVKP